MSDDSSSEPANEAALKAVEAHEASKTPKIIRVLTVCAYLFTVSVAAIMLSIYYIFLWDPKIPGAATGDVTNTISGHDNRHFKRH